MDPSLRHVPRGSLGSAAGANFQVWWKFRRAHRILRLDFKYVVFGAVRKSLIFGVWAAPAAPKTKPVGGSLRPPPFGLVFGTAGAAQTPKIGDPRPAQKPCMNNPSVLWRGTLNLSRGHRASRRISGSEGSRSGFLAKWFFGGLGYQG